MKASALVSVLAFVGLLVTACDRGEKTSSSSSGSSSGAKNAPTIKLVNPGKDPKTVLRFKGQKDLKQTVVMKMDMAMTMNLGGSPRTQKVPTIAMPMDVVVTDVTKDGDFAFKFEMRDAEILDDGSTNPAVVDAMKTAMAGMKGLGGTAVVTSRGYTKDVEIKTPPGANPQVVQMIDSLKQSIGQMSAPLPEEAVGVGAQWETTMSVAQNGMKMTQVAKTELVALEGDVITLSIKINQSAPKQKISNNGMTADLQRYSGTGGGESVIELTKVVPKSAKVDLKSDMELKAGEQSVSMGFDISVTMAAQ